MFTIRRFAVALLAACAFASQSQAGYLGANYLVANEQNTLSDVSFSNVAPQNLRVGSVVFGYQSLGQVGNNANGTADLSTGTAWVVFSFTVASITSPILGPGAGTTYVTLVPTLAANPDSLQSLVPNLVSQAGLSPTASSQLLALEVNSSPGGTNQEKNIRHLSSMTAAMGYFNSPTVGSPFATEFAFGQVAANGDFLTVFAPNGALGGSNGITEAGGATILYSDPSDGYTGFGQVGNTNPNFGNSFNLTNQVTIAGSVYGVPGVGAAPPAQTGAHATDHATYSFLPETPTAAPEPSTIVLFSIGAPFLLGMMRRRLKGRAV